jgi:hypothetical protein
MTSLVTAPERRSAASFRPADKEVRTAAMVTMPGPAATATYLRSAAETASRTRVTSNCFPPVTSSLHHHAVKS